MEEAVKAQTSAATSEIAGLTSTNDTGGNTGSTDSPIRCQPTSYQPNYCRETDPSNNTANVMHWWQTYPLQIYFSASPTLHSTNINSLVLKAFNYWSNSVGFEVAVETKDLNKAHVVVDYPTSATMPGGTWIGRATWSYLPFNMQVIFGNVYLRLWDNMTAAEVADGLRQTAQHEFGHILFMGGHSPVAADSMYPWGITDQYKSLTLRDENSYKTSYCGTVYN